MLIKSRLIIQLVYSFDICICIRPCQSLHYGTCSNQCHENRVRPPHSWWQAPKPSLGWTPGQDETPLQGEDPSQLTHRVHVEEERVVMLVGVEAFNSVHQGWVGVVEVRMGNEYGCIWMRTKTP